jgi:peptide/nickel transport system permease protein
LSYAAPPGHPRDAGGGFIAFSLFNFVGDPVSLMLPPEATQADREQMRQQLGLDQPFYRSS